MFDSLVKRSLRWRTIMGRRNSEEHAPCGRQWNYTKVLSGRLQNHDAASEAIAVYRICAGPEQRQSERIEYHDDQCRGS